MRRLVPFLIITWSLFVTIARAIRLPNDFSEAHWLLDYRFGFMKRALMGSLCNVALSSLGLRMTAAIITGLSAIIFIALCACLLLIVFRLLRCHDSGQDTPIMAMVVVSSPFVVMSAHVFGYFDALLYVITIASVALMLSDRPFLAASVASVAVLTHESYIVMGFPLTCLASVALHASRGHRAPTLPHVIAWCVPLLVFLVIPLSQALATDRDLLRQQLSDHLSSFGFVEGMGDCVAEWQTTSFLTFFLFQKHYFISHLKDFDIMAMVLPSLLAILYFIHSMFKVRLFSPLSIMTVGCVAAPLALHVVAWDSARISTYTVGGAFIAAWIFAETRVAQPCDKMFVLLAIPAILFNIEGRIPLMDNETERFQNAALLMLYLPAMALVLYAVLKRVVSEYSTDLTLEWTPPKSAKALGPESD